ncbi:integrase [Salmonella enterica subsp. enterica serovar Agona str. 400095 17]|nr:integrase [Salmonella enterica subsp. enterica serovar Agona str. SH08SF124]ELP16746.1 integrase [Salmonella enterica subsp. enterica serovar Agona str. SH10GFN094]ELP21817.1 integrase [Salmonella enterica subsp. enterica serovar Agona str. SH11G1113]ESB09101.1 integrase [Salmonella enterica subsp. enterica serovar Agona str. 311387-1]ESB09859.1 integrase [Salmonella enterica subsp. enterica serovar Agona str. 339787]ESB21649.1 integrase [Salmonella enterica subsp. enterica serovar Agona st
MVRASRCHRLNMKTYIINDSEVSRLSVVIHRYAHLAPNHLTEHAREIDDIFGDDVPNMSHMENKEEIKKRNALIYKWRALQDSNLRPTA